MISHVAYFVIDHLTINQNLHLVRTKDLVTMMQLQ